MNRQKQTGFTIVELLIVIVVIGILAAITIVAFNGVQKRARDTQRLSDANAIVKSIEQYKVLNGNFPPIGYSGLGNQSGWEASAREANGEFLAPLKTLNFSDGVPVDPINNATGDSHTEAWSLGHYSYYYYLYSAGQHGCDPSRGRYYVLGIMNMENSDGKHSDSPGHSCGTTRDWNDEYEWVTGGYEN